jgi:hypothetical protein
MNRFALIILIQTLLPAILMADPVIRGIRPNADTVGLYDKYELRLVVDAVYENPFDPADISLEAVFRSPSGVEWRIVGFYNYSEWNSLWMVRFAPQETGQWQYRLELRDKTGATRSPEGNFTVVPSKSGGPIRVAANKRYLEYHNGKPFYGVGFWYNDSYTAFNKGRVDPGELDRLKRLGVNFISTFITPLETMGSGMGRYDQNICGRLDELLEMCEARDIQLSLNIWFHSYLSATVWGGGNVRWQTNPYQLVCEAKDFYSSEAAWKYQEQLYRYMIARWGYSRSLGIWFVIDEVNGTDGWVTGDSLGAARWGGRVHEYLTKNDPYRHLTTGTRSGGIKEWWHEGYQVFDLAAREIYEAQGFPIITTGTMEDMKTHPLTHSYTNYATEIGKLWKGYEKPAIIGETGWDHTFFEPAMPGYLAQYHNALWVSLATGTAMTPFWWAHAPLINDNMISSQLTSFRKFVDLIPFQSLKNPAPARVSISKGDAYGIQSDQFVFGWAANPVTDVAGAEITVQSLAPGRYKVRLYHTWRGRFLQEEEVNATGGKIKIAVPVLHIEGSHANYAGPDVAFILERLP